MTEEVPKKPTRLIILDYIEKHSGMSASVSNLIKHTDLKVNYSTVSDHIKRLCKNGFMNEDRGRWYFVQPIARLNKFKQTPRCLNCRRGKCGWHMSNGVVTSGKGRGSRGRK